ncbi:retrovirus-related pol polyprotein from transposon TNT 1-94 [Tanacetum coccineum]|uniref:Retrovirus-related pol polyprotein from transposon TNT 1-94 n=1 Tax=Tanacetum coccineum TaxID=301880 RepID=A0ABQ5CUF2_9ASTR
MPSHLQPPTTLLGANPIPHRSYIPYRDRRLSISEEALGAFGKSQTYRYPSEDIQRIYELFVKCRGQIQGRGYDRGQEAEQKQVEIMDKEVNQAARDSDDALVCCVENTVEDRIMDSGASFHATYCKEELERFKLRSGKVRLADDKTLDIAGVGDVVLKTSFGTSWTLKDVRYIPSLKRRLISVGQLDEEGYHVGFRDQQWKVTKGSLVVAHGNKRGSLYMVEVHPEGIGAIINGSGSAAVWFGEAEESFLHNVSEDKETAETAAGVANGIVMLKMVPKTPLQFGVAERLSRTFRAESTGLRAEAPKMLWADSVSTTYLIYRIPYVPIGLRILEEEWRGKDTSLAHLKVFGCDSFVKVKDVCGEAMKCTFIGSGSDEMRYNFGIRRVTSQVVLVDIPENLVENDSIVAEHGLSSKITLSPGQVRKRSWKALVKPIYGRPHYGIYTPLHALERWLVGCNFHIVNAFLMVSLEKNQTCSLVRISAGKKASQRLWMFKEPSYVRALNDTSTQHKSEGFQLAGQKENLECRLNEILYGLIQAPRLRALNPKGSAKVTTIPSKDERNLNNLLSLDDLIGILKVYERARKELVLMILNLDGLDEEYALAIRDSKILQKTRTIHPNNLIEECPKLSKYQNQKAFVGGSWSDSDEDKEEKTKDEKCLMAKASNEEFDAEPVTFAMMALTELEEDDWSMEIDAEPMHFGQDGLGDFDWSNTADDTPVSLALMATNSEVPYCSKCSKSYKKLLENYQTERDNFQKARTKILGYQMSLESLEVILKTHEKNEYAWGDKYEQMEYDLKMRDLKLEEKQKELDQALKERDDFKVKLEKWSNAAVLQNEVLNKQRYVSDKSCLGIG